MKFQMIIAACLVLGAQFASATAPTGSTDCAKNASVTGTGVMGPQESKKKIEDTEVKTASVAQPTAKAQK